MDSSSAVDSAMDEYDASQKPRKTVVKRKDKRQWLAGTEKYGGGEDENDDEEEEEQYDAEAWETLSKSFREAQLVLDQNRALIQQVNENHQSKITDNLVKNVALIREINGNISKVSSLYSNLSVSFVNGVQQRRANSKNSNEKMERADS